MGVFPLRKIKRNGKYLFVGAVLVVVGLAAYLEHVATDRWSNVDGILQKPANQDPVSSNDMVWSSKFIPQPWRQTYKGRVNLHVFEDWCGSSVASFRKNLHFPLYPHSRITVKKLAVSPNWRNYGLRIFGYIHPYIGSEFLFAVASSSNCEFWLSRDENPENLRLRAYVGKTGEEWSAPGEYGKYASQISKPVLLQQEKRFYFELIYKHNDRVTDHVEVAWKLNKAGMQFEIIDFNSLSLYTDESTLKMSDVRHIPQTAASHVAPPLKNTHTLHLREDPRDTFFKTPLLDKSQLWGVLPECSYKPSYTVKGRTISRYQGLQFVHLTYVYPNDYTRLTHMESDNTCFYQLKPYYLKIFGFSHYMKLDQLEEQVQVEEQDQLEEQVARFRGDGDSRAGWKGYRVMGRAGLDQDTQDEEDFDYGEDEIQQLQHRKILSNSLNKKSLTRRRRAKNQDMGRVERAQKENLVREKISEKEKNDKQNKPEDDEQHTPEKENKMENQKGRGRAEKVPAQKELQVNLLKLEDKAPNQEQRSGREIPHFINKIENHPEMMLKTSNPQPHGADSMIHEDPHDLVHLKDRFITTVLREGGGFVKRGGVDTHKVLANEGADGWVTYGDSEMEAEMASEAAYDREIRWDQTFDAGQTDFQMLRSDWIDLNCNVSGNLLISQSEVTAVVQAFMKRLELKFPGRFSLQRVVNVEKRVLRGWVGGGVGGRGDGGGVGGRLGGGGGDGWRGVGGVRGDGGGWGDGGRSRYLLELELTESSRASVRLVYYVTVLKNRNEPRSRVMPELLLCNTHTFLWNPEATIHIIVPVKNQARWVQKFIVDMEELHRVTGDKNVNIIIADYSSTDMDIEETLKNSHLPRFQYLRLTGNFERSSGLQAGIDLIPDAHSIVFLCDLHLHFPLSFFDSVRKHCVEGQLVFAPLLMRLDCGATPEEPDGYWEVNGFGLLGIYKSDLDAVGGMNTREFTNRWGGEDWELLDRIVEAGLEVERLHLRNFFHYHHSKRGMWNHRTSRGT